MHVQSHPCLPRSFIRALLTFNRRSWPQVLVLCGGRNSSASDGRLDVRAQDVGLVGTEFIRNELQRSRRCPVLMVSLLRPAPPFIRTACAVCAVSCDLCLCLCVLTQAWHHLSSGGWWGGGWLGRADTRVGSSCRGVGRCLGDGGSLGQYFGSWWRVSLPVSQTPCDLHSGSLRYVRLVKC